MSNPDKNHCFCGAHFNERQTKKSLHGVSAVEKNKAERWARGAVLHFQ